MNSRERFRAVADGMSPDRAPVCLWHHYFGEQALGQSNIDAQVEFVQESQVDIVKISMDGYFEYPLSTPVHTASDWARLRPLEKSHPYFTQQIERAQQITQRLGSDHPTLYVIFSPFSTLRHTVSDEVIMAHVRENKEAVRAGMQVVLNDTLSLMRGVMELGACDGMLLPLQSAEENRFTAEEYHALLHPFDAAIYSAAGEYTDYNISHLCGWSGVKNRLECWEGLDSRVRVVNWATAVEELSLAQGKAHFAPRPVMGGFDNCPGSLLHTGGETAIKAETKRLLASVNGEAILGADCSLPADIDRAHIRWVVEASNEFAQEKRGK